MSGSLTALKLHVIRAPISGTIRTIYKQPGEAVKNLDPVVLLQNTRHLFVQTQIDVQDALPLRRQASTWRGAYRAEANRSTDEPGRRRPEG